DRIDHRVKEYLEDAGYEKWSRVHATVNRGRMMTSNIVECINDCLVETDRRTLTSDPNNVIAETVHPPRYRKLSGQPRKQRRKNADEKISVNTNCCGQCGKEGHNRRTCTLFPKEK
ncbi:hypothetical protein EJD97_010421, partial [Solanum chilense]